MRRTTTRQRAGYLGSCTNQIGLKMSGGSNGVGRKGYLARYIGSRVQQNQKYCGPVMYQGQIWRTNTKPCVKKAPRTQSFNSGVGHKGNPRFACNKTCSTDKTDAKMDSLTAIRILKAYITKKYKGAGSLILVAKRETLTSDHVEHPEKFDKIKHFYLGSPDYINLPAPVKRAAKIINALQIMRPLKEDGPLFVHVVGYESYAGQKALGDKKYGTGPPIFFGPLLSNLVAIFGIFNSCGKNDQWPCYLPGQTESGCDDKFWVDDGSQSRYWGYFPCYTRNAICDHPMPKCVSEN